MEKFDSQLSYDEALKEAKKVQDEILANATALDYKKAQAKVEKKQSTIILPIQESADNVGAKIEEIKRRLKEGEEIVLPEEKYPISLDEIYIKLSLSLFAGRENELRFAGRKIFIEWFIDSPENNKAKKDSKKLKNFFKYVPEPFRDESDLIGFFLANGLAKNAEDAKKWIEEMCEGSINQGRMLEKAIDLNGNPVYLFTEDYDM